MVKIYIGRGQGGSVRVRYAHNVYVSEPHIKSYTSYVLLRNYLLLKDVDYIENENRKRVEFSRQYLRKQLKINGCLTCKYCGKTNLIIEEEDMKVPRRKMATTDHVVPVSKGGAVYDEKNVVVACYHCNSKKSNLDLEDFLKKYGLLQYYLLHA
jgi:5-methylcytosine-specific restriction endonuclease McrA